MKLSIIIPALNEEKYLPLLLESIRIQSFTDYEIIVADAGSHDGTLDIARSYGCKIVLGGLPAAARNSGARSATGKLLLFLDSDVILPPGFLERSIAAFESRNLGVAGFLLKPLDGKTVDTAIYWGLDQFVRAMHGWFYHGASAIMVKKEVHEDINGFNEAITMIEDYYYMKSAAKVSRYGYIRQPVKVSMRRYEKDGRFTYAKYALAALYTHVIGPITKDIFNYQFNHYHKK